uniref:ubiquitinyl hydrolase 1 n=1 Tax=Sphenodon punctatus TaxID=8508 RepID=A0A8D0GQG1_SPHPU
MTAELQDQEGVAESPAGATCQMLLNQLQEITGIQEPSFLRAALKVANGDLTQAINFLMEECVKEPGQEAFAVEPCDCEGSAAGKELPTNAIDQTPDNKDNLQAAVTLSLLESPEARAGERDPKKPTNGAHEADSAESKHCSKRKRCEVWGESSAQQEWRRADDWPVGMKNIGNTCWFSAVIQVRGC